MQRVDQQQGLQGVLAALGQVVRGRALPQEEEKTLVFFMAHGPFPPPPLRRFAAAFALRQRMLNFVQNIQYYMMFEVMEPTWHIMENNLKTVSGQIKALVSELIMNVKIHL